MFKNQTRTDVFNPLAHTHYHVSNVLEPSQKRRLLLQKDSLKTLLFHFSILSIQYPPGPKMVIYLL